MSERRAEHLQDARLAALLGLGVIVMSFFPPLGVVLLPGLIPAAIFFPEGIHSNYALLFLLFLIFFSFLFWGGLAFGLIRLFRKFRRRW